MPDYVRELADVKARQTLLGMSKKILDSIEKDVVESGNLEMFFKYLILCRRYDRQIAIFNLKIQILELLISIEENKKK